MGKEDQETSRQDGFAVERGLFACDNATLNMRDVSFNNYSQGPPQPPTLSGALRFREMNYRECSIADAHQQTCEWFLNSSQYLAWSAFPPAHQNHGFLWIKGHAGAGKSTIMKFILEHARNMQPRQSLCDRRQSTLNLSHFFNARGVALEKSAEGMYRTLLAMLLQELPDAASQALNASFHVRSETESWPVAELERLFKRAVGALGDRPVVFYIDALDECPTSEARKMLWVFRDLINTSWNSNRKGQVRVCFASRPYPNITFEEALFLDMSKQEGHSLDIEQYVRDRLHIGHSEIAAQVRKSILSKARGIFMWVILVVDRLNEEYDDGNVNKLQETMEEIPEGLHALFRHTLDRYPESRDALLTCFRWKLFELEELTVQQLWWGIQLGLGRKEEEFSKEYDSLHLADMCRYVVSVSRGLLKIESFFFRRHGELRSEPTQLRRRVQLIHESIRDFMFKDNGFKEVFGSHGRHDFEAHGHELLKAWCFAELKARQAELVPAFSASSNSFISIDRIFESKGWKSTGKFPLMVYAARRLLHHAEEAQKHGRNQTLFLEALPANIAVLPYFSDFLLKDFSLDSPAQPMRIFHTDTVLGLLEVLLETTCPVLIRETQLESARQARKKGVPIGLHRPSCTLVDTVWFTPDLQFSEKGSYQTAMALVEIVLQLDARSHGLQGLLNKLGHSWSHRPAIDYFRPDPGSFRLMEVAEMYPRLAIFFLLAMAPGAALQPHLHMLENLIWPASSASNPGSPDMDLDLDEYLQYLQVVRFFIQQKLTSDAIDLHDQYLLKWYQDYGALCKACESENESIGVWTEVVRGTLADYNPSSMMFPDSMGFKDLQGKVQSCTRISVPEGALPYTDSMVHSLVQDTLKLLEYRHGLRAGPVQILGVRLDFWNG